MSNPVASRKPTKAQKQVLEHLATLRPGTLGVDDVFTYYSNRPGRTSPYSGYRGLSKVSRRGAAGRMWWSLHDAGYLERYESYNNTLTEAGRQAVR